LLAIATRYSTDVRFHATDPASGRTWEVDPLDYPTRRQLRKMSTRPDTILQFSRHLARELRTQGHERIEVRAEVLVSLNGREPRPLVDSTVDLAAQRGTRWPASWILPLEGGAPGAGLAGRARRLGDPE
jgi:vitamin K-dependent gamma-carboxylase